MNLQKRLYKAECNARKTELGRMSRAERKEELKNVVHRWKEYCKQVPLETGFGDFDECGGIRTSCVTTVYGHRGSGKTAFVMNVVVNLLKQGKRCTILSMDKPKEEIRVMLACIVAKTSKEQVESNSLTADEKRRFDAAVEWLEQQKLDVYDGHFIEKDIYRIVYEANANDESPDLLIVDAISEIIPTRNDNGIGILSYIKNYKTAVVVTEESGGRLKDVELRKASDILVKLKRTCLRRSTKRLIELENRGAFYDITMRIVKNRRGKRKEIVLRGDGCVFEEKPAKRLT